jgi:hypothetical protein
VSIRVLGTNTTDQLTQVRLALLNNYSSQSITHGTYVIGLSVLFFTWVQVSGFAGGSTLSRLVESFLSSFIIMAIVYEGMRTLYWGYLSNMIIGLGYHIKDGRIDFEKWMEEDWLDDSDRGALRVALGYDDLLLQVQQAASPNLVRETRTIFKFLRWSHKRSHRQSFVLVLLLAIVTLVFYVL